MRDWKKQIPNLDFWCRWSTDLCVKQIDIGVILRAFSQNCKCVSIGVVRSIGEYDSLCLSGLVSARGGGRGKGGWGFRIPSLMTPTVSDSLPALCGSAWFSIVLRLPLIHRSRSVAILQQRTVEKVDLLKTRFLFLLVRWSVWSLLVVTELDFWGAVLFSVMSTFYSFNIIN